MSIYITGDTHFVNDIEKLFRFLETDEGARLTESDYVIICGDFGAEWNDQLAKSLREIYAEFPWTTLFVDGNHENHARLDALPVERWNGGKIHRLGANIIHLMRGQVFTIEGHTFFTMGGATSIDRASRKEGTDWWAHELPYSSEYTEAWSNLNEYNFEVDYILTHCAPTNILEDYYPYYQPDCLTDFLRSVWRHVDFKHWFCGHYHQDISLLSNFHVCYNVIRRLAI